MANKLTKEIWVSDLQENPIPALSFLNASTDLSVYVNNDTIHLQEAGIEPGVHIDYFEGSEADLPLASIQDIPSEVVLNTYSTERTRHRNLQEVELAYNKRQSIMNRHRTALAKTMGLRAAHSWTPDTANAFNKKVAIGSDSFIDAVIDMQQFFAGADKMEGLNICLSAAHVAKLQKEDKVLYKALFNKEQDNLYGFKVWMYSQTPVFTSAGVKKPVGAIVDPTDTRSTFFWATDEVFKCFGTVEMYATIGAASIQADEVSFAQRALVGNIRAAAPKYRGVIY